MLTFVETKLFTQRVQRYLSDDEYAALQNAIIANPEAGDVIRGSGGVRQLRWGLAGRGKRGGVRVMYAKNEADTIPASVLTKIKEELDGKD